MTRQQFLAPVPVKVDGIMQEVASVADALEFLRRWPTRRRGPVFGCALNSCNAAISGQLSAEQARQAFASFARISGILVGTEKIINPTKFHEGGKTSIKKGSAIIALAMVGVVAIASLGLQAAPARAMHASCEATVHLTDDAEKRMGGALYEGRMESAEAMPGPTAAMPGMAGAHEVHRGQQGGVFFMAPDRTRHVEARYSQECGIQLFIYNAFTEPIGVERFQAFFKIIPEDRGEWDKEVIRFLSPAAAGGVLQARGDNDIRGPYKIELYVKFPESDDAEMFNVPVG